MTKAGALVLFGLVYSAMAPASENYPFAGYCAVSMTNMVASSNQSLMFAEQVGATDLRIESEEDEGQLMLQLFDRRKKSTPETPGAGHLGWVTYYPKTNRLTDINDEPLKFDVQKGKRYQQCLTRMQECQALSQKLNLEATINFPRYVLTGNSRAWFYAAPVPQCRSESVFIVPGDIVARTGFSIARDAETQKIYAAARGADPHGYLLAGYQGVVGWVVADNLKAVDEVCDEARQKSGEQDPPAGKFVTRTVDNQHQRLYFHDAPDKACLNEEQKFIVDKDEVKALDKPAVDGYVFIRYTHPVTHHVTDGWVMASGLK